MNGIDKARAVADGLRKETEAEKKESEQTKALIVNDLKSIQENEALAKMYSDSAQVGAENLAGELPLLKVHSVGRSESILADGSEPTDGYFFYKPTQEQFESIRCHVLTISKGFKAKGLEGGKAEVFNQILSGIILDGKEMKPFMMYMTGLKLAPMWEFGKEIAKYTRVKPMGIPIFTLTVKLTTERVKNSFGKSWIVKFEVEKNDGGNPVLVGDPGEFQYLRDAVDGIEGVIENVILQKEIKPQDAQPVPAKEVKPVEPALPGGEGVNEISF